MQLLSIHAILFTLLQSGTAFAHGDVKHTGNPRLAWHLDPWPLMLIGGMSAWYFNGWRRIRQRGGELRYQAWLFCLGMLFLCIALLPRIDTYSAALVSVHMLQHMLLVIFATRPPVFAWGLPHAPRHSVVHGTRTVLLESARHVLTTPPARVLLNVGVPLRAIRDTAVEDFCQELDQRYPMLLHDEIETGEAAE